MSELIEEQPWYSFDVPRRIETPRLVLRAHEPGDAAALKAAIDANLEHLQRWMSWAMDEPSPLSVIEERVRQFESTFVTGPSWGFLILERPTLDIIGGVGMHADIGPNAVQVGYWLDKDHVGRGYATEAAAALTKVALALPNVERVEIRCDPRNEASAAIPKRLGFRHTATLENDTKTPSGEPRATMVWEITRADALHLDPP
jgi:RimJ/RimL family protein N-acetyltransferase